MEAKVLQPINPDFDLIGGAAAVDNLVDAFYRNMDLRPQAQTIRAMHSDDLEPTKAILKLYLREWLNGPAEYTARRGHPRLQHRHIHFPIGPVERDAWLACKNSALDETVSEPSLRDRLKRSFHKLADWFRNDLENEHDKHH
jgi:hemoglobin